MRKYALIGLVLLLLTGCAAERRVVGNTFQSSFPQMNIRVDDHFKYLAKTSSTGQVKSTGGTSDFGTKTENYLFIPTNTKSHLQEFLMVQIREIETPGTWVGGLYGGTRNLDYSMVDLQGEKYEYYSRILIPAGNWQVRNYLFDSGYTLPPCLLLGGFARIMYGNLDIGLHYYRDATAYEMSCKNKYSKESLSSKEQDGIQSLRQRALRFFGGKDAEASAQPLRKPE